MENSTVAVSNSTQNAMYGDSDRCEIAREATYEIEALCDLLLQQSEEVRYIHEHYGMTIGLQIRGIAKRVKELNSAIMSSIDDPMMSNEYLKSAIE